MAKLSLLEKLSWALNTIEHKVTFGLPEAQAQIARERRLHGVLLEAEDELKELEDHLISMAEEALKADPKVMESKHYKFAMELREKRLVLKY